MNALAAVGGARRSPARAVAPVDSDIRERMLRSLQKASDVSTLSVARQELTRLIDDLREPAQARSFAVILSQTTSMQPLLMRKTTFLLLDRFFEHRAELAAPSFTLLLAYMCKRMSDPEITQQSYQSQISCTFAAFARLAVQCGRSQQLFDYLSFQIRKYSIQTQIVALNALSEVIAASPRFENTATAGELCISVASKLHDGVRYSLQFSALRCLSSLMDLGYENASLPRIALKSLELRYFRSRAAAYVILEKAVLLDYFKHRVDEAKQIFVQIQRRKYDQVADVRIAAFRACQVFRELLQQTDPVWVQEVTSRSASRSGSRDGTERANFRDFRDRIAVSSRSPATHTLGNVTDPEDDVYDFSGYRQREASAYKASEDQETAAELVTAHYFTDIPSIGEQALYGGSAAQYSAYDAGDQRQYPPEIELSATAAPLSYSAESTAGSTRGSASRNQTLHSYTISAVSSNGVSGAVPTEEGPDYQTEDSQMQSTTQSGVSGTESAHGSSSAREISCEREHSEKRYSRDSATVSVVSEPMERLSLESRGTYTERAIDKEGDGVETRTIGEKANCSDRASSHLLHSADVYYFGDLPVNLQVPMKRQGSSAPQYQMPQFVGDMFTTPRRYEFCGQKFSSTFADTAHKPADSRLPWWGLANNQPGGMLGSGLNSGLNSIGASPMPIQQMRGERRESQPERGLENFLGLQNGFYPSRPSSAAAFLTRGSGRSEKFDAAARYAQQPSGDAVDVAMQLQSRRTPRTSVAEQNLSYARAVQPSNRYNSAQRASADSSPSFYQTSNASVVAYAEARRGELNQSYATMLFRSETVSARRLREEALRLMNRTGPCLNILDDDIVVRLAECIIELISDGFIDQMLPWIHQLMQKRHLLALEHAVRILGGLGQIWSAHPRWHDVEQLKREIWLYYPQLEEQ